MWVVIIELLAKVGMALLGTFFASTAQAAQTAGVDGSALNYVAQLVSSAQANTELKTGAQMYDWVFSQAVSYFNTRGIDMAISLMESLVQLAVHNFQVDNAIVGGTVAKVAAAQKT